MSILLLDSQTNTRKKMPAVTLTEMETCAAETLSYFIKTMPDVPFTEDDIIIEFAGKKNMAKRAKALCAKYVPDKIINESQTAQLNESIAANALIGREKSAVIVCINHRLNRQILRRILFHEFVHIYCAKMEIDGEHFIDIYGSGHTPDENPDDKVRDGFLNAGYVVWSEFIAQYYALMHTSDRTHTFEEVDDYVFDLISGVTAEYIDFSKGAFSQAAAYWLTCRDAAETLDMLNDPEYIISDSDKYGKETKSTLHNCLNYLYTQTKRDKPWKISEDFIETLGSGFNVFRVMNSFYLDSQI